MGEPKLRREVLLGGLLAVAMALALAGGVRDAGAAFPGASGRIAYVSDRDAGTGEPAELFAIDPDGTDRVQLTTSPGQEGNPAWSADGAKIAFDRDGDLFVINADGSGETNVTNSPGSFELEPAWSPDGTKLVFRRVNELFTIGVDGTNELQLTDYPDFFNTSDFQPAWSPDGAKIVFASTRDDQLLFRAELYTMNADGTAETRLTNSDGLGDVAPNWSPDGTKIVWQRENPAGSNQDDIFVMNADGTGETRVPSGNARDVNPAWSPDGTKIVFQSENAFIFTFNPDGRELTQVTSGAVPVETSDRDPDWGPVGSVLRTLTVSKSGGGNGTVTSTPAGVDCGADCTESYADGSSVTLTAAASDGSTFDAWTGCDSVAAEACTLAMTSDRSVTATFVPSPTVSSLSPSSGPTAGGTSVTISGTELNGATAVTFGGVAAASFTVDSDTQITAVSPAHAAGTVDVRVTGPGGTSANTASDNYTFVAPPAAPAVSNLTPNTGSTAGGTAVTITGSDLAGATSVTFGGVAAAFTVDSATQIRATSPPHAAGTVDVIVMTPAGTSANTSADDFTFVVPPPPACTITGTPGPDTLTGTSGDDRMCGLGGNDTIRGLNGNDILLGGAGDDVLDGGGGADELIGESGIDTASYASTGSSVVADLDGVADDGPAGPKDRIATDVENIVGGSGNDTLTGSSGANALTGGPGGDTLDGGNGADALAGGDGFDTVSYSTREERVVVNTQVVGGDGAPGEGDDVAQDVERIVGGGGDDVLTTGSGNQILLGNRGNDILSGGSGQDELRGGDGNDLLLAGGGDDDLYGENGDDVLEGGPGPDDFNGGAGRDTVTYGLRSARVTVSLDGDNNDGGAGERDRVRDDVERLVGGQGDDLLLGDHSSGQELLGLGGDDELRGFDGDDILDGGPGADDLHGDRELNEQGGAIGDDHLLGGPGDDLLHGDSGDDLLDGGPGGDLLDGGFGIDTVSYAARTRGVRVLQDGVANDGEPGERDDVRLVSSLVGSPFDDVLEGALFRGTLSGGAGHDTLIGSDAANTSETLLGGPGNDTLRGRRGADSLSGEGGRDDLQGDAEKDQLFGGDGNDELFGGPDNDFLDGGTGSDTLHGGADNNGTLAHDTISYEGRPENLNLSLDGERNDGAPGEQDTILGAETVIGGNGSDTITGNSGSNRLHGGPGNDTLTGRQGDDLLFGGADDDELAGGTGTNTLFGGSGFDRCDRGQAGTVSECESG